MRSPASFLVLVLVSLSCGCLANPIADPVITNASSTEVVSDEAALTNSLNKFSFALFDRLSQENSQKNVFVSPLSVGTALSMLLLGARSTSATELMQGLAFDHVNNSNETTIHQTFGELINSSIRNGSSVALANYLMIRKEVNESDVLQKFKSDVSQKYGAKVDDVNFSANGPEILTSVNQWVNESTEGRIASIIDSPPSPDVVALLLNAISFKGEWEQKFRKGNTQKMRFLNNGLNESELEYMRKDSKYFPHKYGVIGGVNVSVLQMPYTEDSMSMIIVLPEGNDGLHKIVSSGNFTSDIRELVSTMDDMHEEEMNLSIPKFKLETDYSLKPTLSSMGIREVFDQGSADLSGINGQANLFVSDVKHKAVVKVDEEGTEAAAVTMIEVQTRSGKESSKPAIDFKADHPFLFLIGNFSQSSGLIYFIGKVETL